MLIVQRHYYISQLIYLLIFSRLFCSPALSQQISTHEEITGQRVMQVFDFEERDIHLNTLPMHWRKYTNSQSNEFAHFSEGRLDTLHPRSGNHSFLLNSDGTSVGFFYHRRKIQAKPGNDFQITGYVRLENVHNSRAQITCALTNRRGQYIEGSEFKSRLVSVADQGPEGWIRLDVYVPGNFPEARFITVGVWLLQESQWNLDIISGTHILRPDVHAQAWFDDISVTQLPRVILRTEKIGNTFDGKDPIELLVEVEGVGNLNYQVKLEVKNAGGELISEESWILTGVEGATKSRKIVLPEIPAGLYRSKLSIYSGNNLVSSRHLVLLKLAPLIGSSSSSGANFGILGLDDSSGDWQSLTHLTQLSNAKLLKTPVWRKDDKAEGTFSDPGFDQKLIELQKKNIELVATFSDVPKSMATQLEYGQRTIFDALSQQVEIWEPQVAFVLAQYARQVPFWQLGTNQFDKFITWDPRIKPTVETLELQFNKFITTPQINIPLNGYHKITPEETGSEHITVSIPSTILPESIPEYINEFKSKGFASIWSTVEPLNIDKYHRNYRLVDFSKRIAYTKISESDYIFIDHPWSQIEDNATKQIEPTELFPIYRTMSDLIDYTSYIGEFEIKPDIPALIFDRGDEGVLFVSNNNYKSDDPAEKSTVQLYLGNNPRGYDIFGNPVPIKVNNGIGTFSVTRWPVLINRVDSRVAGMRSSLKLNPVVLNATIKRQGIQLTFKNTFGIPISGRLKFVPNESQQAWSIDPITSNFVLGPDKTFDEIIMIKFPRNEIGGFKKIKVQFLIEADRSYNFFTDLPFEIELKDIDVSYFSRRINESDLLIQKVITNNSPTTVNLISFVDLPDNDRMERPVRRLQPDAFTTKSFLIPDAQKWFGQYIRLGLYDPKGTSRINYQIQIN